MSESAEVAALPPRLQSELVVQRIKDMIRRGTLSAGQRLPIEKELASELDVSRGSLREGVRALCMMGVLETRQGDGTYVTSLEPGLMLAPLGFVVDLQDSPGGVAEVQAIRRVLETEAAQIAARLVTDETLERLAAILTEIEPLLSGDLTDADHERIMDADLVFHRTIAEASDNRALAALIEALASRTARGRLWRTIHEEGAAIGAHREHLQILSALRRRDPGAAAIQMSHHLLGVEEFLRANPGSAS